MSDTTRQRPAVSAITVQREQARQRAVRDAEISDALACEYRFWHEQIRAKATEANKRTSPVVRKSVAVDLLRQLRAAELAAAADADGHREHARQITSALVAASTGARFANGGVVTTPGPTLIGEAPGEPTSLVDVWDSTVLQDCAATEVTP